MATHSSMLAWKIPWTENPRLQFTGSQRTGHDWETNTHIYTQVCIPWGPLTAERSIRKRKPIWSLSPETSRADPWSSTKHSFKYKIISKFWKLKAGHSWSVSFVFKSQHLCDMWPGDGRTLDSEPWLWPSTDAPHSPSLTAERTIILWRPLTQMEWASYVCLSEQVTLWKATIHQVVFVHQSTLESSHFIILLRLYLFPPHYQRQLLISVLMVWWFSTSSLSTCWWPFSITNLNKQDWVFPFYYQSVPLSK